MSKMFNKLTTSGATTVTEKLGLDSEVRELKFGSSFNPSSGNRGGQSAGAFHSIKYDFKPASVDKSKAATLEVGPNGQVSISMPHYDNTGSTVFKGSTRPYTKECVLIIDKDTGEIVLEKLSHNVQVKKTRQEGSGKNSSKEAGNQLADVGSAAVPGRSSFKDNNREEERENSSSSRNSSFATSNKRPSSSSLNLPTSGNRRANSPLPFATSASSSHLSRHSPLPSSPSSFENASSHGGGGGKQSNSSAAAFDVLVSKQVVPPTMHSLTSLEDLITTAPSQPLQSLPPQSSTSSNSPSNHSSKKGTHHHHHHHHQKPIVAPIHPQGGGNSPAAGVVKQNKHGSSSTLDKKSTSGDTMIMSDSSDDSSSSSSSEEEDDDSSSASDMEDVALPPSIAGPAAAATAAMPAIPMDISSVRGNPRPPPPTQPPPRVLPQQSSNNVPGSMPNFFSLAENNNMPSHVLSEDLQLSESSGSSSDSD